MDKLLTVGQIGRKLEASAQHVRYAIDKARIVERGRVGIYRLFSPDQLPSIQDAIASIRKHQPAAAAAEES